MKKGGATRLVVLLLAVAGYAALVGAGIAPNPFPVIWEWLSAERPLAPDLAWQERIGARPAAAAAAGDALAIDAGTSTQLRERDSGARISPERSEDWEATTWLVVAGGPEAGVVIVRSHSSDGYQVRNPATGGVIFREDRAGTVWGFREAWLDLRCGGTNDRACQLRYFRVPAAGDRVVPVWTTDLPGERSGMLGANPELAGPRGPAPHRIHPAVAGPEPVPPLLGLTTTRGGTEVVVVVRTFDGAVLQELARSGDERIIVAGDGVVRSVMERHSGVCVSTVSGHDPLNRVPVWGPQPYHLWTTKDMGCEQREPPMGEGAAMVAVRPDGRPVVIDAYDGRVLWTGELDERVEDLSPELAVIRAADQTTRYAVRLGGDGSRIWERSADPDAGVALAGCGVVVADQAPDRVYVWDLGTGQTRLSLATSASVLACPPDGVVIAEGRSIGFAPLGGVPTGPSGRPDPLPEPK
jgi:hypothetical protein